MCTVCPPTARTERDWRGTNGVHRRLHCQFQVKAQVSRSRMVSVRRHAPHACGPPLDHGISREWINWTNKIIIKNTKDERLETWNIVIYMRAIENWEYPSLGIAMHTTTYQERSYRSKSARRQQWKAISKWYLANKSATRWDENNRSSNECGRRGKRGEGGLGSHQGTKVPKMGDIDT